MKIGTTDIVNVKIGETQVKEVRIGNDLVWSSEFSWNPLDLGASLLAWWRGDSGLSFSGSNVTTWTDLASNEIVATAQGTFGVVNDASINNQQIVNVGNNYFTLTNELALLLSGKSGVTLVAFISRVVTNQEQPIIDLGINNSNSKLYAEFRGNDTLLTQARSVAGDTSFATSTFTVVNTNYNLIGIKFDVQNEEITHILNNAKESPVSQSYNQSAFNNNTGDLHTLFAYFDGGLIGNFRVAELMLINQAIDDETLDKLAWYINDRYDTSINYIIGDPSL